MHGVRGRRDITGHSNVRATTEKLGVKQPSCRQSTPPTRVKSSRSRSRSFWRRTHRSGPTRPRSISIVGLQVARISARKFSTAPLSSLSVPSIPTPSPRRMTSPTPPSAHASTTSAMNLRIRSTRGSRACTPTRRYPCHSQVRSRPFAGLRRFASRSDVSRRLLCRFARSNGDSRSFNESGRPHGVSVRQESVLSFFPQCLFLAPIRLRFFMIPSGFTGVLQCASWH